MQVIIRHISIYIVKGSRYRSGDISAVEISRHILVVYRLIVFLAASAMAAPQIRETDVERIADTQAHVAHRGCLSQRGGHLAGACVILYHHMAKIIICLSFSYLSVPAAFYSSSFAWEKYKSGIYTL